MENIDTNEASSNNHRSGTTKRSRTEFIDPNRSSNTEIYGLGKKQPIYLGRSINKNDDIRFKMHDRRRPVESVSYFLIVPNNSSMLNLASNKANNTYLQDIDVSQLK